MCCAKTNIYSTHLSGRPVPYDNGLHLDLEELQPLLVRGVQLFPEGGANLLEGDGLLELLLVLLLPHRGKLEWVDKSYIKAYTG